MFGALATPDFRVECVPMLTLSAHHVRASTRENIDGQRCFALRAIQRRKLKQLRHLRRHRTSLLSRKQDSNLAVYISNESTTNYIKQVPESQAVESGLTAPTVP